MSVVGVDFGAKNSVIAAAAGTGGVDVILNGNSQRLNPMGEAAASTATSNDKNTITSMTTSNYKNTIASIKRLVGLSYEDARAQAEMKKVAYACVPYSHSDEGPNGIAVSVTLAGEAKTIPIEMIAGVMVKHMGSVAANKAAAESNCDPSKCVPRDWVVSVPGYYTDAQRRAFLAGCEMAGVAEVQRLMNEGTATALAYGISKDIRKEFTKETPTHVMFVDMGATTYSVSVVDFQPGKLVVKSAQYDPDLGGRDFDDVIAHWIADKFEEKFKDKLLRDKPKVMLKLAAAAEKAKKTLSPAGVKEAQIKLECIKDDLDFSVVLKADKYKAMCEPLLARLGAPIERALSEAGVKSSELTSVEIVGGATRVASVKEKLAEILGLDGLSTSMNADEAVAQGCALQSAILSPRFKDLRYEVIEYQQFPIKIEWDGTHEAGMEVDADDQNPTPTNSLIMFERGCNFPIVRTVTLRGSGKFTVDAMYDESATDFQFPERANKAIASFHINAPEDSDCKIRVNVKQDIHGSLTLSSAQMVEEVVEEEPAPTEGEGAEAKAEGGGGEEVKADGGEGEEVKADDKPKEPKLKKTVLEFSILRPFDWTPAEIQKENKVEVAEKNAYRIVHPADYMGSSITERCRKRKDWVMGEYFPGEKKENWVCEEEGCENKFCVCYRNYMNSKSRLEEQRSTVEESQQKLQENQRKLEESQQELEEIQQELEDSLKSQKPETEVQSLTRKLVQEKQKSVQMQQELLQSGQELLQSGQEHLQSGQDLLQAQHENLLKQCDVLLKEHTTMKEVLIGGKAAGNNTAYQTQCTKRTELEYELEQDDAAKSPGANELPSPSKLYVALREDPEQLSIGSIEEVCGKHGLKQGDKRVANLKEFYIYCDNLFNHSEKSTHEYMSDRYAEDIKRTAKAIVGWEPDDLVARIKFVRPSHCAEETRGSHPILLALGWKINSILKGTAHFTSEQFLPKQLEKSKRWMDAMCSKDTQHFLSSADGNLMGKSAEFKPLSRIGQNHEKMIEDGKNQIIGHNIQVLWDSCYQFCGGLGKDGEASGIVLTMISATIINSGLSGVGTENVQLKMSCTGTLPLFSERTTRKLADGLDFKSLSESLKLSLGSTSSANNASPTMQPGFVALVDFILEKGTTEDTSEISMAPTNESTCGVNHISISGAKFLGSGAFSSAYECQLHAPNDKTPAKDSDEAAAGEEMEGKQAVIKMSKNRDISALKNELKALKALNHDSIPKLFKNHIVKLEVKVRCERNHVHGLLLNVDIGKSLQQMLQQEGHDVVKSQMQEMLIILEDVLRYAHSKEWFHLDIQPSNIILVPKVDGSHKYILIDWGTAEKRGSELKKFHGSPPFSHPEMFLVKKEKGDQWKGPKPKPDFDNFSLAMTLACIQHGGVPWSGFHNKVVTKHMLTDRYDKAVELIRGSGLKKKSVKKVLGWMNAQTLSGKKRKR